MSRAADVKLELLAEARKHRRRENYERRFLHPHSLKFNFKVKHHHHQYSHDHVHLKLNLIPFPNHRQKQKERRSRTPTCTRDKCPPHKVVPSWDTVLKWEMCTPPPRSSTSSVRPSSSFAASFCIILIHLKLQETGSSGFIFEKSPTLSYSDLIPVYKRT